jgi:hypothetical protein
VAALFQSFSKFSVVLLYRDLQYRSLIETELLWGIDKDPSHRGTGFPKLTEHSTNNTKHSKYKYTYYQNTHTVVKTPPHVHTLTYYKTR